MRVIDLQDVLRSFDENLTEETADKQALAKSWGIKKIMFGAKHKGNTYLEV